MKAAEGVNLAKIVIPDWQSRLWTTIAQGNGQWPPLQNSCITFHQGHCPYLNSQIALRCMESRKTRIARDSLITPVQDCQMVRLVEMLADHWLQEKDINHPPVPNSLVSLADSEHPIETWLIPLECHYGAAWYDENVWVIQLKQDISWGNMRFALFHEAFHIMMHTRIPLVTGKQEVPRGAFIEFLANWFSGSLLLPRTWLTEYWQAGYSVPRLAKLFEVPIPVLRVRLQRLGII